ncbi:hypothetical protein [Microvirga zambiensis]|uniref:hypothetical protein n=1 Tax=Microvirga zambiensis TaxID=1402137 RepID=UPI00191E592E|nr:hypothetical protein [Microvirga zambiensis]
MSQELGGNKPIKGHEDPRIKRPPPTADDSAWTANASIVDPRDLGPLFADRARLLGEDEAIYNELLSKVVAALMPRDIIEAIWVKEFVDRIYDGQFYRRVRVGFLSDTQNEAVQRLLQLDSSVIARWVAGDKAARASVEKALKDRGLDWDTIRGRALSNKLDKLEQLDDLIGGADARRDKALHNLERRRESGARPHPPIIEGIRADYPVPR